jgi:hypothetical protein
VQQQRASSSRHYARQRAGLAALEAAVAAKAAQVADLEAARGTLAQRAHVLETMVADTDKLLQVLSSSSAPPHGWCQQQQQQQQPGNMQELQQPPAGAASVVPQPPAEGPPCRLLHIMFDHGSAQNPAAWSLDTALQRWREYVGALRPLLQAVAAARARHAKQAAAEEEEQAALGVGRRPRRAAAAALSRMSALAQQLDQDQEEGVDPGAAGGLGAEWRLPPVSLPGSSPDGGNPCSCCWPPAGEVDGRLVYGGPGTQGVPLELLAQVGRGQGGVVLGGWSSAGWG